jgi:hypothetical protein
MHFVRRSSQDGWLRTTTKICAGRISQVGQPTTGIFSPGIIVKLDAIVADENHLALPKFEGREKVLKIEIQDIPSPFELPRVRSDRMFVPELVPVRTALFKEIMEPPCCA